MATNPNAPGSRSDQDVLRAHGYHCVRVKEIIEETHDARSFVLDIPEYLIGTFQYRPGQFCTFRVHIGDQEYLRSYSMSSAPETDSDLTVTVKRVPGGIISNWFLDQVHLGDSLETTKPAGVFCLQDREVPIVAFCGGSGVTPVMSITKSALASTSRSVKFVYANRSRDSVIFGGALDELRDKHPDRLEIYHHLDSDSGFLDADAVTRLAGTRIDSDFYICGPTPFMDLVETTLLGRGVSPDHIFIERFLIGGEPPPPVDTAESAGDTSMPESLTIIMKGKPTLVPYQRGDTVLETARRGALQPPFSCEAGNCATCMAILREGSANMRVNNALTAEEVDEGWILTCQALPVGPAVTVEYESF